MDDLHRGSYTGMFGFLIVEGRITRALRSGTLSGAARLGAVFHQPAMDNDDLDPTLAKPEKPEVLDTRPPGMEVTADIFSINDKALGAGEPIRVRPGERVLFHFLNASAIENRHLRCPATNST